MKPAKNEGPIRLVLADVNETLVLVQRLSSFVPIFFAKASLTLYLWLGMTVVIAAIEAADGGGPVARGRNSERVEETLGQRRRV